MKMTQEQRDADRISQCANRAKRMAELEELFPHTLRCVEVLKQHAPTLEYVRQWQDTHCTIVYRMDLPVVKDVLAHIAEVENVCEETIFAIYKADYCCCKFPKTK